MDVMCAQHSLGADVIPNELLARNGAAHSNLCQLHSAAERGCCICVGSVNETGKLNVA